MLPIFKFDYNEVEKIINGEKKYKEKDYLSLIEFSKNRGILLIETEFDEELDLTDEIDCIYEQLEKFQDITRIDLSELSYFIVEKIPKIYSEEDYNGNESLAVINFKADEKLEKDIVNNDELQEFINILKECTDITLKDIVNISSYYNSNLFTLKEIFDMTLKHKDIEKYFYVQALSRLLNVKNKIMLEFMGYLSDDNKKRIR